MKRAINPELQVLLERSFQLRAQAAHLIERATEIDQEMTAHAPVKIDDVIPTRGHSYQGKDMQIIRVAVVRMHAGQAIFRAWGHVLKKDGTAGTTVASAYWRMDGTEMEGPFQ